MKKDKNNEALKILLNEDLEVSTRIHGDKNKLGLSICIGILTLSLIGGGAFVVYKTGTDNISLVEPEQIAFVAAPVSATAANKSIINIPEGIVNPNPFEPYRELVKKDPVDNVPADVLIEPPDTANENSNAARVMDTIVSGILYDKFSPSAILNIEGNDYLVKKGDVVNNYKVENITVDSVSVSLDGNSYKAGIGEILTEGSLNHNDVSNLNNKFGGINNES